MKIRALKIKKLLAGRKNCGIATGQTFGLDQNNLLGGQSSLIQIRSTVSHTIGYRSLSTTTPVFYELGYQWRDPNVRFKVKVPIINPLTNVAFTSEELAFFKLTNLKTIHRWFKIETRTDNQGRIRPICPGYSSLVGNKSLIYIYRLINEPYKSYIGSAADGSIRFESHGYSCARYMKGFGTPNPIGPACPAFYEAVRLYG